MPGVLIVTRGAYFFGKPTGRGLNIRITRKPRLVFLLLITLTFLNIGFHQLMPDTLQERIERGEPANILLIGTDARPGEIQARSDTMMLVSLNKSKKRVVVISIPRDTRIIFQGSDTKINMVNQRKGPRALCREAETLLNTDADYYITTSFAGFERIIDAAGGVYLDVDITLHSYASGVHLEKGYQRLSGKEALKYVRFRANPDMDIGRVRRQQRLVTAFARQLTRPENLGQLPRLVGMFQENVSTNISIKDMIFLSSLARQAKSYDVVTATLPGHHRFSPYSGASYWEADYGKARTLLKELMEAQNEGRDDLPGGKAGKK